MGLEEENLRRIEKGIRRRFKYYDQEENLPQDAEKILSRIKEKGYVDAQSPDGHRWHEVLSKMGTLYMKELKTAKKRRRKLPATKVEARIIEELVGLGGLGSGVLLLGIGIFLYFVGFLASIAMPTPNFSNPESIRNYYNAMKAVYVLVSFAPILCFTGIGIMIVRFYKDWGISIQYQSRETKSK